MARPRIFISSTFYDLKHFRTDLEKFIKSFGYEPVLNENGNIPYGTDERLEEYCYREIQNCDIVVSIIGGRYGSESKSGGDKYSVSNKELETAIKLNKQVYIFINQEVDAAFQIFRQNNDNDEIIYPMVDDIKVLKYIQEVRSKSKNNIICLFSSVDDITSFLKEQWSGLFKDFLLNKSKEDFNNKIKDINTTVETLNQLVKHFSKDKEDSDETVKVLLRRNHPLNKQLKNKFEVKFPFYINTFEDLKNFLYLFDYKGCEVENVEKSKYYYSFSRWEDGFYESYLNFKKDIFDENGFIKDFDDSTWKKEFIINDNWSLSLDDDLPF